MPHNDDNDNGVEVAEGRVISESRAKKLFGSVESAKRAGRQRRKQKARRTIRSGGASQQEAERQAKEIAQKTTRTEQAQKLAKEVSQDRQIKRALQREGAKVGQKFQLKGQDVTAELSPEGRVLLSKTKVAQAPTISPRVRSERRQRQRATAVQRQQPQTQKQRQTGRTQFQQPLRGLSQIEELQVQPQVLSRRERLTRAGILSAETKRSVPAPPTREERLEQFKREREQNIQDILKKKEKAREQGRTEFNLGEITSQELKEIEERGIVPPGKRLILEPNVEKTSQETIGTQRVVTTPQEQIVTLDLDEDSPEIERQLIEDLKKQGFNVEKQGFLIRATKKPPKGKEFIENISETDITTTVKEKTVDKSKPFRARVEEDPTALEFGKELFSEERLAEDPLKTGFRAISPSQIAEAPSATIKAFGEFLASPFTGKTKEEIAGTATKQIERTRREQLLELGGKFSVIEGEKRVEAPRLQQIEAVATSPGGKAIVTGAAAGVGFAAAGEGVAAVTSRLPVGISTRFATAAEAIAVPAGVGAVGLPIAAEVGRKTEAGESPEQIAASIAGDIAGIGIGTQTFTATRKGISRLKVAGKQKIPKESIIPETVITGKQRFPQFPPGKTTIPVAQRAATERQLTREFKDVPEDLPFFNPNAQAAGFHSTITKDLGREVQVGASEFPGLFISPPKRASPAFLRLSGEAERPLISLSLTRPTPTLFAVEAQAGAAAVPKNVLQRTLTSAQRQKLKDAAAGEGRRFTKEGLERLYGRSLSQKEAEQAESAAFYLLFEAPEGQATISPARRVFGKGEAEAIIPRGTQLTKPERAKAFVDIEGFSVPIKKIEAKGKPTGKPSKSDIEETEQVLKELAKASSESERFITSRPRIQAEPSLVGIVSETPSKKPTSSRKTSSETVLSSNLVSSTLKSASSISSRPTPSRPTSRPTSTRPSKVTSRPSQRATRSVSSAISSASSAASSAISRASSSVSSRASSSFSRTTRQVARSRFFAIPDVDFDLSRKPKKTKRKKPTSKRQGRFTPSLVGLEFGLKGKGKAPKGADPFSVRKIFKEAGF